MRRVGQVALLGLAFASNLGAAAIPIVVSRPLAGFVRAVDALYRREHPEARFAVEEGDDGTAMAALAFDATVVAPMGDRFTAAGLTAVRKLGCADPLELRIGWRSADPATPGGSPVVIVNPSNPLRNLTVEQLERIFCIGAPKGGLARWGQVGLSGAWTDVPIACGGLPEYDASDSEDPELGSFLADAVFGGLHFGHEYRSFRRYADVVAWVSETPGAIAIVAADRVSPAVKRIALARDAWSPPSQGLARDVEDGRYPLARPVYLYLRRVSGRAMDPIAVAYARIALSADGQRALATARGGYVGLGMEEAAAERKKLP